MQCNQIPYYCVPLCISICAFVQCNQWSCMAYAERHVGEEWIGVESELWTWPSSPPMIQRF